MREREFVEAARALGASDARIIVRHILPNIIQPVLVQAAIGMAGAILAEATMSFLGLGVPPPTASWGAMLNDAARICSIRHTSCCFPPALSCWPCCPSTSSATGCATILIRARGLRLGCNLLLCAGR